MYLNKPEQILRDQLVRNCCRRRTIGRKSSDSLYRIQSVLRHARNYQFGQRWHLSGCCHVVQRRRSGRIIDARIQQNVSRRVHFRFNDIRIRWLITHRDWRHWRKNTDIIWCDCFAAGYC